MTEVNAQPGVAAGKIWRVALSTRIVIGFLAAFMYGLAALMVSLPLMFDGKDHSGDWMIDGVAVVMMGFALFATFALVAVTRIRIALDGAALEATVVDGHNVLLVPHFRSVRLPLPEIRSVERRSEIFRTLGILTTRDALSIVTASGERIGLFSNTLGSADTLPLDDVAVGIAAAAGITVTDDGTVRTRGSGLYGAASSSWTEAPLEPVAADRARNAAILTAQIGSALVLFVFVLRACL